MRGGNDPSEKSCSDTNRNSEFKVKKSRKMAIRIIATQSPIDHLSGFSLCEDNLLVITNIQRRNKNASLFLFC